ncbi:MAG: AI-2E family transporter [Ignavibacteriales bacterium]|nr:AI-2E family transporter [Ignavibacteriales bacterium]
MKKISIDSTTKFFISVIGIICIVLVLKELQHIFIPFIIAYFLFFMYQPLNKFLVSKKIPYGLTILFNIIITIGFLYGLSTVIIESFSDLSAHLPLYKSKLNNIVSTTSISLGITDPNLTNFQISELLEGLDYGGIASSFFNSTLSLLSTVFFVLFFFIFISSGHEKIISAIKLRFSERRVAESLKKVKKELKKKNLSQVVNEETYQKEIDISVNKTEITVGNTFQDMTGQLQKYITTKLIINICVSIIMFVILLIFNIDFIIVWVVLSFFLTFIPNIGSVVSIFFPTLMCLLQFESIPKSLLLAGILIVVQNVIGNILEPKIFGGRLGLNPLVILLSLLIWGYIWGIVGMFISVPLTAMFKIILSKSRNKNLEFINNIMG